MSTWRIQTAEGDEVHVGRTGQGDVLLSIVTKTGRVSGAGSVILTERVAAQVATAIMHAYQGRPEEAS